MVEQSLLRVSLYPLPIVVAASALLVPEFVESSAKDAFFAGGICVVCNVFAALHNDDADEDARDDDAMLE